MAKKKEKPQGARSPNKGLAYIAKSSQVCELKKKDSAEDREVKVREEHHCKFPGLYPAILTWLNSGVDGLSWGSGERNY